MTIPGIVKTLAPATTSSLHGRSRADQIKGQENTGELSEHPHWSPAIMTTADTARSDDDQVEVEIIKHERDAACGSTYARRKMTGAELNVTVNQSDVDKRQRLAKQVQDVHGGGKMFQIGA
jgi:hypothetical protein